MTFLKARLNKTVDELADLYKKCFDDTSKDNIFDGWKFEMKHENNVAINPQFLKKLGKQVRTFRKEVMNAMEKCYTNLLNDYEEVTS
jgi:TRAP-type mannitol/chloroaromatic compound transport system substrate-binding protein